ncbi:hypothetical protein D9M68_824920 [compost metagenome]
MDRMVQITRVAESAEVTNQLTIIRVARPAMAMVAQDTFRPSMVLYSTMVTSVLATAFRSMAPDSCRCMPVPPMITIHRKAPRVEASMPPSTT